MRHRVPHLFALILTLLLWPPSASAEARTGGVTAAGAVEWPSQHSAAPSQLGLPTFEHGGVDVTSRGTEGKQAPLQPAFRTLLVLVMSVQDADGAASTARSRRSLLAYDATAPPASR